MSRVSVVKDDSRDSAECYRECVCCVPDILIPTLRGRGEGETRDKDEDIEETNKQKGKREHKDTGSIE